MFEPKIFRKQMFRIEESTCDIVGTIRHPGHCAPLYPLVTPLVECCVLLRSLNLERLCSLQ